MAIVKTPTLYKKLPNEVKKTKKNLTFSPVTCSRRYGRRSDYRSILQWWRKFQRKGMRVYGSKLWREGKLLFYQ